MLTIHCPSCHVRLTVPVDAGGRAARCPQCKCKFQVPDPSTMLDETVTAWLDLDNLDEIQQECEQLDDACEAEPFAGTIAPLAAPSPTPTPTDNGGSAQPSTGHADTSKNESGDESPASRGRRGGSFVTGRVAKASGKPVPRREVPEEGGTDADAIQLYVQEVGSFGVRLMFASHLLKLPAFRASLPLRCIITGETDPSQLIARPLPWVDKATGHFANPGEMEARYEFNVRHHMTARQVVKQMTTILELPEPFNLPMPYYVSRKLRSKTGTIHCETVASSQGVQCEVVLPDIRYALEWLGRVNGVCGPEYEALEQQAAKFEAEAWQGIPEQVRNRLAVWFDFEGDETFLGYFNDSDFSRSDAGLAGVVLTDRRIVFTKYHAHGTLALTATGRLIGEPDGTFVQLYYVNGGQRKLVRLRPEDAQELGRMLEELGGTLRMVTSRAGEPTPEDESVEVSGK